MIAYKLVRQRKDGTLGSLFINRKDVLQKDVWLTAKPYPTKGFAVRPGWHCTKFPEAPHLSMNGRVWVKVDIEEFKEFKRPESQGGIWFIANRMKILSD